MGFWEKLRRMRRNLGLLMLVESCGVVGSAVAAARAAPEAVVVMVEAAVEVMRELGLKEMKEWCWRWVLVKLVVMGGCWWWKGMVV